MSIDISDLTKRKAIKILEDEQTQLVGAYDRNAVKGVSPGMESEFIPETSELAQRKETRVVEDGKGKYSKEEVIVSEKFYDEGLVEEKEKQFEDDAKTLQEVAKAYDQEMNRLNGLINDIKVEIVDLSSIASQINCWPGMAVSTGDPAGDIAKSFRQETIVNNDVERTKIYLKMAGPGYDPGTENPFEPDTVVSVESTYAGYGYENIRDNNEYLIKTASGITSTGKAADGSGSNIGNGQFELGDQASDHDPIVVTGTSGYNYPGPGIDQHLLVSLGGSYDSGDSYYDPNIPDAGDKCASIAQQIESKYEQIITIRKERDSYRKKLNQIKKSKLEKELSHWGYQNTKNEVNVRRNKNSGAILAVNQLDSEDAGVEAGLCFHLDASSNSSYYGSGDIWYDISESGQDADNEADIFNAGVLNNGGENLFVEDPINSEVNHFALNNAATASEDYNDAIQFKIYSGTTSDPNAGFITDSTEVVTVEIVAQLLIDEVLNKSNGFNMFGWGNYSVWTGRLTPGYPPALGFRTSLADLYGLTPDQVENLRINNSTQERQFDQLPASWRHYTFVMANGSVLGDAAIERQKIYINAVSQSLSQIPNYQSPFPATMNFNVQTDGSTKFAEGAIGVRRTNFSDERMPMEIALFRVYNKELTQEEININFEEVRSRFNL